MGVFFFKAYADSSKEEKDKLRDVMLKHEVLPEFEKFLKPNWRNIREERRLYSSLTAFDVIKLGFWYLHKAKKVDKNAMTLLVNLLYPSYYQIPSDYNFSDLQVPKG